MTTAVISVRASETVKEAHADMQVGAFRHLPVVDDRGRLVGIMSDRDVIGTLTKQREVKVAEVMSRAVISVRPDTAAHQAALLLLEHKIGAVPVVDEKGGLVGMLTQTDFLELAHRALLGMPLGRL